jgi:4-amino-4-deoxy-L-arabinose transferase-like glycosyltransferase
MKMRNRRLRGLVAAGVAIIVLASVIDLERVPPLWWDEGWTMTVARNWVERGWYGRLLNGELAPPGLNASFPIVASVALSFRLLGVGIWQARLPGVMYGLGALALLYLLGRQLFNRWVAVGAVLCALLVSDDPALNPILLSRQVLAEIPMLFFLLGGYLTFRLAMRRSTWYMPLALACWGVALIMKAQLLPFWFISLIVPLAMVLLKRQWRPVGLLVAGLLGSWLVFQLLIQWQGLILAGHTLAGAPLAGIYEVTALVTDPTVRSEAMGLALTTGLPALLGYGFAGITVLRQFRHALPEENVQIIRVALLSLGASWLAWYILLAMSWSRYLGPPLFVGSLFVSALLYELTDHFRFRSAVQRLSWQADWKTLARNVAPLVLAVILMVAGVLRTFIGLSIESLSRQDAAPQRVAAYLNTQTAADALIETYESELYFLIQRRYHYPPDQIHIELNRRTFLNEAVPIDYDPLTVEPDYIVTGRFGRQWKLYDAAIASGGYRLVFSTDLYQVYKRAP